MRIERTGEIKPLTPRVDRFLREALGGVSLDDVQSPTELRADYACLDGVLAVELKSLEEDASARMDNLTGELRERDDWPMFLGSAPIASFIANMNDPEGVQRRVLDRIGRGIINHLKKANRQLEAHSLTFPRDRLVKALVLVNEDHEVYDPHLVSYLLWHAVRRMNGEEPLYAHVDLVIYLSERHAQIVNNRLAFPTLVVEGKGVSDEPWKSRIGHIITEKWARWIRVPLYDGDVDPAAFTTIDHIPESAPLHERWRTDYRRNPYLRPLTFEQLRDRFDEITLITMLGMLKSSPLKVPMDEGNRNIERFTHMMVEMAQRAIPITSFPADTTRSIAAARRMKMPEAVSQWLAAERWKAPPPAET